MSAPAGSGGAIALCRACAGHALVTLDTEPDTLRLLVSVGDTSRCAHLVPRAHADLGACMAKARALGAQVAALAEPLEAPAPSAGPPPAPTRVVLRPPGHGAIWSSRLTFARTVTGTVSSIWRDRFASGEPALVAGFLVRPPDGVALGEGDRVEGELDETGVPLWLQVNDRRV